MSDPEKTKDPDPAEVRLDLLRRAVESQTDRSAYNPNVSPGVGRDLPRWVFYTPEMAAQVISELNPNNRNMSVATVEMYRMAMEAGLWNPTHQGVAFGDDGFLIDGQHRFAALAEADVEGVWFLVSFGVPVGYFGDIDKARKRQAFHFLPGKNTSAKAAALRAMAKNYPNLVAQPSKVTDLDLYLRYLDNYETMEKAVELAVTVYHGCRIHTSFHAAMLAVVFAEGTPEVIAKVPGWIEGLKTGAAMSAADPRLTLRNRFMRDAQYLNSSAARGEAMYLILRAWSGYLSGESLVRLVLPSGVSSTAVQSVKTSL